MGRRIQAAPEPFDRELADLPPDLRWREWMGRVEAAIFASPTPIPRESLNRLVGSACPLEDLIADIQDELRARPYELVFVAGGWHHRTRPRFAAAIRASEVVGSGSGLDLSPADLAVLAAIAYLQPLTRGELAGVFGAEVSRDRIARLRGADLIASGPRSPLPGAPATYVTTPAFLAAFGFSSLRDLPDIERLEDAGLLDKTVLSANPLKVLREPDDGSPGTDDAREALEDEQSTDLA
jgi:chromosome segregation and condensation protein ScpB